MSHNRQLDELLSRVRKTAETATKEEDFRSAFSLLRDFRQTVGPIKYDNSVKWGVFAAIAAVGCGFALAYFLSPAMNRGLGDTGYVILGLGAAMLIAMLVIIGTANSAIGEISELIFRKDVCFDNRLEQVDIRDREKALYREMKAAFGDFRDRGDENRYIKRLTKSVWHGKEHVIPYEYYVFHYVRVYYVPVTRKVGKTTVTTMERRTETLYRYGLILDFPYLKGFVARSSGGSFDYPEGFQPSSEGFNGIFSVSADRAQTAAKLLKPAVVLAFLDLAKHLSGLNVEVNREGRLNVSFSDSDVLELERRFSIAQPDEFEREISSHLELPKLRRLLEFVETLMKHSDSNF